MALKVYRTPIGFHDAYVAAPSQKAALAAWGSDKDLFARGMAEVVTDPALTAEPLARPGTVVKRLRGSTAEQLAAAPAKVKKQGGKQRKRTAPPVQARAPQSPPRPARDEVDAAELALAQAEDRHRQEERQLAEAEAALAERRRALRQNWTEERDRLEAARIGAEDRYAEALRSWQARLDRQGLDPSSSPA